MQRIKDIIQEDPILNRMLSSPRKTAECGVCHRQDSSKVDVRYYPKHGDIWLCDLCENKLSMEIAKKDRRQYPEKYLPCCGLFGDDLNKSFENFEGFRKKIMQFENYANSNNLCNMILYSEINGNGKSHIAKAIVRRLVQRGVDLHKVYFITTYNLLLEIRSTFDRKPGTAELTEKDIIEIYSQMDLLVIDDLGAEKQTDYSIATLTSLIDNRLRLNKPTIITTNLSLDRIGERLGNRLASRLSSFKIVRMNLPDFRKSRRKG